MNCWMWPQNHKWCRSHPLNVSGVLFNTVGFRIRACFALRINATITKGVYDQIEISTSSWLRLPPFLDLNPPESDPLPGDRPAEPGGRADPGKGRPGPATAGGEPAGAEPGCWQDPTGDHHQVSEGHTGWDQSGRKQGVCACMSEKRQQGAPLYCKIYDLSPLKMVLVLL